MLLKYIFDISIIYIYILYTIAIKFGNIGIFLTKKEIKKALPSPQKCYE